jgi:ubiquitin carboxyl-terminal hydrolase 48
VVKENQKLHLGKDELLDDNATLAELNILPGANLWVMDTGQHENRDITGMRFSWFVIKSST